MNNPQDIHNMPIFFIMGRPRSGTTLLRMLFDAHPNVRIPTEFPLFLFLYQRFRKVKDWDEKTILAFVDSIFQITQFHHRPIEYLKIDRTVFTSNLMTLAHKGTIQDFLKMFNYLSYSLFPKSKILAIGDKNPLYSIYIKRFVRIFPEAKFICITRDYRDNYISMKGFKDLELEAPILPLQVARWRYVSKIMLTCLKKYPDQFYLIRYEDLVTDKETSYRKLCEFLHIPYDSSVFDFFLKKEEAIQGLPVEIIEKYHKSLMNPINTGRMDLWKKELTEDQVKLADQIAGKAADQIGYQRKYRNFSVQTYLRSLPMVIYGYIVFRLMFFSSYLPYRLSRWMALNLVILVKTYNYFRKKKKRDDQAK